MEQADVQQVFFQHIKNNLPPHLSLVDEIAELLNISNDSAYRRIRGEKGISFDEIRTLCLHFKISLDQLFYLNSESVIFTGNLANSTNFSFDLWLLYILKQVEYMKDKDNAANVPAYPIHNSILSLYYKEPVNINSIYSDNFQQYVDIKKVDTNKYRVSFPNGHCNYYSYAQGVCTRVDVEQPLFNLQFLLNR